MEDKILFCRDCHNLFVFSIKEQQYFEKKRWGAPCRCSSCRKERRKDPYAGWQSTMGGPRYVRRGHKRVHYSGLIIAGGLSN